MNLILLEPAELDPAGRARLTGARADHVREVLRAAPGDRIRVGVVDGPRGAAEILRADAEGVELSVTLESAPPPPPPVDLLLAVPRPKVLKRLWAPLAAVGVRRLVLTNAWRVEKSYFATHVLDPGFRRARLLEGLQQARDTRLPEVIVCDRFRPLVEDRLDELFPGGARLLADPGEHPSPREAVLAAGAERAVVAVGPEGGWSDFERDALAARGFRPVSLGPRPLRSDTACIALLALVHDGLRAAAVVPGAAP